MNLFSRKKCHICNKKLLNILFQKNSRFYKLKSDLNTCRVCRFCTFKTWFKDMHTWKYSHEDNKFVKIIFNNKIEIIKKIFLTP
jgi:hypothetical protein